MNKNKVTKTARNFTTYFGILSIILTVVLAPACFLRAQTFSEGLWNEFVEDDPAAAKKLYENIINDAGSKSTNESIIKKAQMRLKAIETDGNIKNYSSARQLSDYKACLANLKNIAAATELYLMENEKFKKENIKDNFINELFHKKYLKTEPVCAAGGKYNFKNSEFICSTHGAGSKMMEFKIVKIKEGGEKIISAPKIKTLIYHDAMVTVGTQNANDDTLEANIKTAAARKQGEELKFLKINAKLSKDSETALTHEIIADIFINIILAGAEKGERNMQFNAKYKLGCDKDKWIEISRPQGNALKDYKIYMKVY